MSTDKAGKLASLLAEAASLARETAGDHCTNPEEAFTQIIKAFPNLMAERKENFVALFLDGRRRVIGAEVISIGTLTAALVHPREVYRPAILAGAASILVAHNHPSGDPTPSSEDRLLTERLSQAGRLLGINLDDHLVVGAGTFVSHRNMGILCG